MLLAVYGIIAIAGLQPVAVRCNFPGGVITSIVIDPVVTIYQNSLGGKVTAG